MKILYDETELDTVSEMEYVKEHLELEEDLEEQIEMSEDEIEEMSKDEKEMWEYVKKNTPTKKEECKTKCEEEKEDKEYRCPDSKHTPLEANCKSEIHVKPKNKIIYVCPRAAQYFLATSSKCCGQIKVKFIGYGFNPKFKKVCGNLGTYFILNAGILFVPKKNLQPGEIDVLPFEAFDGCNKFRFDVVFTFDPCKCCNK